MWNEKHFVIYIYIYIYDDDIFSLSDHMKCFVLKQKITVPCYNYSWYVIYHCSFYFNCGRLTCDGHDAALFHFPYLIF